MQEQAQKQNSGSCKFSDMNLKVGEKLQMAPPPALGEEKHLVRLVGYRENVSVMTTLPIRGVLPLPLREGDELTLSVFSGIHAFWFTSVVLKICKMPFDYLHLSYPEVVGGVMTIRKALRIQTKIAASVTEPISHESKPCVVSNLSIDGVQALSPHELGEPGKVLNLTFHISPLGVKSSIEASVVIRSMNAAKGESKFFSHGMQFLDIDAKSKLAIGSFLHQQMIEGGKLL